MKKVAVIFGGSSTERDVSLHTGLSVIEAIKNRYDVLPINLSNDFRDLNEQLLDIDLVFLALHGGFGEDGTIQKYLENYNITYTGSDSKSSAIAMDKNKTKLIAKKNKIPVLNWFVINNENEIDITRLNFPLIIKPNDGGSTIGLYFCKDKNEFNINIKKSLAFSDKTKNIFNSLN